MAEQIILTLKMPPSTNQLWKRTKKGIRISDKAREYHIHVQEMLDNFNIDPKINVPVSVHVITHFADKRKHDIDNIVKVLFDSLTLAEFWEDDELVDRFTVQRGELRDMAVIEMTVHPIMEFL